MNKSGVIEDIECMLSCPGIKSIPVIAFLLNRKVREWFAVVINPVEGQDGDIRLTHSQASQVVKTMVNVVIQMTHLVMVIVWVESLTETLQAVELVIHCQLAHIRIGTIRKSRRPSIDLTEIR
jgi:hypothetical protein